MSVFQSAVETVLSAIEMQRAFQADDLLPVRIGIHMGDIVFSDTEVYGESVNVTARIESMGVSGLILISEY